MNGGFLRSTQMVFKLESSLLNPKDALVPVSLINVCCIMTVPKDVVCSYL